MSALSTDMLSTVGIGAIPWASYSHNHGVLQTPLDFLANQILGMNPLSLPLWGAGLGFYFSKRGAR